VAVLKKPFDIVPLGSARGTFYHSDCLDVFAQLPARSVDVMVTSPPYNLGINYNTYRDTKTDEEYLDWCEEWGASIARILAPDGSFFLNLGGASENPFFPFLVAMRVAKFFELQNTIHWIKSISIEREEGIMSYGHFKPINSPRFVNDCHEYVFHFTPEGKSKIDRLAIGVPYMDKSNVSDGLTPMAATNVAEATLGLCLTRRFTSEPCSARILQLSQSNWQQSAYGCMENAMLRFWILFSA